LILIISEKMKPEIVAIFFSRQMPKVLGVNFKIIKIIINIFPNNFANI